MEMLGKYKYEAGEMGRPAAMPMEDDSCFKTVSDIHPFHIYWHYFVLSVL
jgi:hypothetical protein